VQDLGPVSALYYREIRRRARSFDTLAAVNVRRLMPLATPGGGELEVRAHEISPDVFDLLGVTAPALGRLFTDEEYQRRPEGAVMITFDEWRSRYGSDPSVIGRVIGRIRGGRFPAVVVGVLPPDFRPLEAFAGVGEQPGYYFPNDAGSLPDDRGWEPWFVLGRLKPGVSTAVAGQELERIQADVSRAYPNAPGIRQPNGSPYRLGVNGLQAQTVGASSRVLGLFLGGAALLLLLAAMNAAALLVARTLDRSKEFGIRAALGAGRGRLARLVLCEAALLASAGGVLGMLLAYAGVDAFLRLAPSSIPRLHAVVIDSRVLLVIVVTTLLSGTMLGLLPALRLRTRGPWQELQAGASTIAEPTRLRPVLVASQMALAVVLLSGAGLLFNSFVRIRAVEPGFDVDRLVAVTLPYKGSSVVGGLPLPEAWDRILDELRAVPGVESVAGTTTPPFQSPYWLVRAQLPEDAPGTWREGIAAYAITPNYLTTMGTRLKSGRALSRSDVSGAERAALVNESFVRTHMAGVNPIGTALRLTDDTLSLRVVGVIEDVIQQRPEDGFRPAIYVPHTQYAGTAFVVAMVRTQLPAETMVAALGAVSTGIVPGRPPDVRMMRDLMNSTLSTPKFRAMLIAGFALAATLLAAVGLYAAMAHMVQRRRRELGIRLALGGTRAALLRLVLGQGLRVSIAGACAGLLLALLLARSLQEFVFGIGVADPATLAGAVGLLIVVAAMASLTPARRAAAIDPLTVLKAG
jgi:predicted permease